MTAREIDPDALLTGVETLELEDGEHVSGVVLCALVTDVATGGEELHVCASSGMSYWTQLGILLDATDGLREPSWRDR